MLWEVERILLELHNQNKHLDILLMENVTQVHNQKNKADFDKWCKSLTSMGYVNFCADLNAKDYGIPQNRNRCFMLSIYDPTGQVQYNFPKPIELTIRLGDILEKNVDECFYLDDEQVQRATYTEFEQGKIKNRLPEDDGGRNISRTLLARDYKDPKLVESP